MFYVLKASTQMEIWIKSFARRTKKSSRLEIKLSLTTSRGKSISSEEELESSATRYGEVEWSVIMCNLPKYHVTVRNENNNYFVCCELSMEMAKALRTHYRVKLNSICYPIIMRIKMSNDGFDFHTQSITSFQLCCAKWQLSIRNFRQAQGWH